MIVSRMLHRPPHRVVTVGVALLLLAACGADEEAGESSGEASGESSGESQAADPELFAGETIDLVVPYDPGGGYDNNARAVAPYLADCLGARVVVRNEPGASGLRATTTTATADPESNRVQIVNTVGLVAAEIAGAEGAANFDLSDFTWLGRVSAPPGVVLVSPDSRFESFEDIVDATDPVRFVAQGPGSGDYINTNVLQTAYGFPVDLITGFAGSPEARAAVMAGDADAFLSTLDSHVGAIQGGDVEPILMVSEEPDPSLPDVPTVYDIEPADQEGQAIRDNLVALLATGRSVIAPPGLDDARTSALREGLACALDDDGLVEQFEAQEMPLNPLGGEETADLVAGLVDADEAFRTVVKTSF